MTYIYAPYKAITITKRSDGLYVNEAWPIRVGISLAMLDEETGPWLSIRRGGREIAFKVANGNAIYAHVDGDDQVWIGHLVDMEFEPPHWLQEGA